MHLIGILCPHINGNAWSNSRQICNWDTYYLYCHYVKQAWLNRKFKPLTFYFHNSRCYSAPTSIFCSTYVHTSVTYQCTDNPENWSYCLQTDIRTYFKLLTLSRFTRSATQPHILVKCSLPADSESKTIYEVTIMLFTSKRKKFHERCPHYKILFTGLKILHT